MKNRWTANPLSQQTARHLPWLLLAFVLLPSPPLMADEGVVFPSWVAVRPPPAPTPESPTVADFHELDEGKTVTLHLPQGDCPNELELPGWSGSALARVSKPEPEPLPPFLEKLKKLNDKVTKMAKIFSPEMHVNAFGTTIRIVPQISATSPGLNITAPFPERPSILAARPGTSAAPKRPPTPKAAPKVEPSKSGLENVHVNPFVPPSKPGP